MPHDRRSLVSSAPLRAALLAVAVITLAACGDSSSGGGASGPDVAGPYPPASTTLTLTDPSRARSLTVEVWYPAVASAEGAARAGGPVEDFFASADDRARYAALLAKSPEPEGPSRRTHAARDAAPASSSTGYPLLVFSHCFQCFRFSAFSIAERLASHGFVVAAPDHAGDTLFDPTLGLTADTLQTRAADIRFVTTALLAGSDGAEALPASLRGALDASRVGVFGHSFGSVTTGLVLQDDARFRAGVGIAAPFENPLLPGVSMSRITEPVLYVVAREDNSIAEIGNNFIRQNFEQAPGPIRKVEVSDAGHWSFSDICRLGDQYFLPGCGAGVRQTIPGESFTYLPIEEGIGIGQAYVTAFFLAELNGDAAARAYLETANPAGIVAVAARN
jgi:predicted dienelactone hydrolase